jgi:hypothetical protein
LAFVGWIARASTDDGRAVDTALWEEELSWILGLDVRVERVAQPELGRTLLYGVEFADPEGPLLGRVRVIELARTARGLEVAAEQAEFQTEGLARLWESLHDRVLRTRGPRDLAIHFTAGTLTLSRRAAGASRQPLAVSLAGVDAWIGESELGPQLSAQFQLAGAPAAAPVQFDVVRENRSGTSPATRFRLATGASPLPCWLLAGAIPELARLGEACEFQGHLSSAAGWRGEATLNGRLQRVDLQQLVARQFPHRLAGFADIALEASLHDGRVQQASGELHSQNGLFGGSLAGAARANDLLKLDESAAALGTDLRFEHLAFKFDLNHDGVQLIGLCDSIGDVVLTDPAGRPLLFRTAGARKPWLALLRTLAASSDSESAPAGTEHLLRLLPHLPPTQPQPVSTRLRLE